jgi:hypothetical protein
MSRKSEIETRKNIIEQARTVGMEEQAIKILDRYDSAIKNAKNNFERQHLAQMGAAELHKLFGCQGPLVINGKEILPGRPGWEKDAEQLRAVQKIE